MARHMLLRLLRSEEACLRALRRELRELARRFKEATRSLTSEAAVIRQVAPSRRAARLRLLPGGEARNDWE